MPFILATGIVLYLFSYGARAEIKAASPEFEALLYQSLGSQLMNRGYPVRAGALFFSPAPTPVKGTVLALRIMYALHTSLLAAFLLTIIFI